jgi:AraC family transcriptional activator FtrA
MPENSKKMTNLRQLSRPQVVVLAYDGLCTFEFGVAVEVFGLPRPEMGDDWYRFAVAALMKVSFGRRAGSASGRRRSELAGTRRPDRGSGLAGNGLAGAGRAVRRFASGQRAGLPGDVHLLRGVRAGRLRVARRTRATTHWRYIETLKARFPAIDVVEDVLYQDEGIF